jgi:hypothetical protein
MQLKISLIIVLNLVLLENLFCNDKTLITIILTEKSISSVEIDLKEEIGNDFNKNMYLILPFTINNIECDNYRVTFQNKLNYSILNYLPRSIDRSFKITCFLKNSNDQGLFITNFGKYNCLNFIQIDSTSTRNIINDFDTNQVNLIYRYSNVMASFPPGTTIQKTSFDFINKQRVTNKLNHQDESYSLYFIFPKYGLWSSIDNILSRIIFFVVGTMMFLIIPLLSNRQYSFLTLSIIILFVLYLILRWTLTFLSYIAIEYSISDTIIILLFSYVYYLIGVKKEKKEFRLKKQKNNKAI